MVWFHLDQRGPRVGTAGVLVFRHASCVLDAALENLRLRSCQLQVGLSPFAIQARTALHEHARVRVERMVVHLLRRTHLHDTAALQHHRSLANVVTQREIVGDEEDG